MASGAVAYTDTEHYLDETLRPTVAGSEGLTESL
jgi:hypothetical protein